MKHLYIMIAAVSLAAAADDPGGWQKAKWGMTDEQILRAFPEAVRVDRPDPYQKARVEIRSLDVAGRPFRIYFSPGPDDKLDHVLFAPIDPATDDMFQSLENLLVEKYGRPWKSEDAGETTLQWTFPTTVISLSRTVLPRFPGMPRLLLVNLIYRRKPPNPL